MVSELQEIFNNREIALGAWIILAIFISIFTKPVQQFLKSIIPILFCRKFVIFYIVFLSYFCFVTYLLYIVGFWTIGLLKDTIFWIVFVELPIFVKTIEKAKDNHFFVKLIKDNIAVIVIIEFVLNFWTFSLLAEIIIVPVTVMVGLLCAVASREKKHQGVKRFFDGVLVIFVIVVIINTVIHIFQNPTEILNVDSLKEFLLPILLLVLNLPIVYGLALHATYEQVFIRIKGNTSEKRKMKWSIIRFVGINLSKITAIRNNPHHVTVISLTNDDMKNNLKKLENRLSKKVGDNFMKRAHFYIFWCITGALLCILGLIFCNSQVSFKEIITFNFLFDIPRIKEIATYICSTGLVFSFCLFLYSLGLKKRKNEELSQVKKYSLHSFLYLIKRQYGLIQEFPPIDAPKELFLQYIAIAYEIKSECDKDISLFENLLTSWELDTIKQLQTATNTLVYSVGIDEEKIKQYTPDSFNGYFSEKKVSAPQSEKINVFIHDIERGIEKYSEQIKLCFEEFKPYIK